MPRGDTGGTYGVEIRLGQMGCPVLSPRVHAISGSKLATHARPLRKIKNRGNNALVAEYKYNGLGYRISIHEDTDSDGDVDGSDKWYHHAFDERWRWVATYRESDTSPKEEYLHHAAGLDGLGTGSYIDLVIYPAGYPQALDTVSTIRRPRRPIVPWVGNRQRPSP